MTEAAALKPTKEDKSAARRFLDGCYDESLQMPGSDSLDRLVAQGWIERLPRGFFEN